MTEQQFFAIVDAFSDYRFAYENKHAQYDHFASTSAAANFRKYARYVDFKGDLNAYFNELAPIIAEIRKNLPDTYRGEYSGGSATLGSSLERFKEHFNGYSSYTPEQHIQHFELLAKRYKNPPPLPNQRVTVQKNTDEHKATPRLYNGLLFACFTALFLFVLTRG